MDPSVKNHRTWAFKDQFHRLPENIQRLADAAFDLFRTNPSHPSLKLHKLGDNDRGRHRDGSFSVSITKKYRAIYTEVDGIRLWYWIGTHNDYDNLTGSK